MISWMWDVIIHRGFSILESGTVAFPGLNHTLPVMPTMMRSYLSQELKRTALTVVTVMTLPSPNSPA